MAAAALLLAFRPDLDGLARRSGLSGVGFGAYVAVDRPDHPGLPAASDRAKDLGVINVAIVCRRIGAAIAAPLVSRRCRGLFCATAGAWPGARPRSGSGGSESVR